MPNQEIEDDTTRATAHLPGLEIEIIHRRSPGAGAEQITINLQAAPSFEAFGRFLEAGNPFTLWVQAAQMAWLPNPALCAAKWNYWACAQDFRREVCTRCFSLCRFLRNVFIAELASDVESVSPCFSRAIKQRASRDCLSEASNTPNIRSNSTNAQAFSNAMLRISVSAESKKSRPKLRGVVVVITVPSCYCCLP